MTPEKKDFSISPKKDIEEPNPENFCPVSFHWHSCKAKTHIPKKYAEVFDYSCAVIAELMLD